MGGFGDSVFVLLSSFSLENLLTVPAPGFTQRATIDPGLNEIHVLSVSSILKYKILILWQFGVTHIQI